MISLVIGIILLAVAVVLWIVLVGGILSFGRSDPAGNGLAVAYSVFIAIALWVVMGLMFLVAVVANRASLMVVVGVIPLLGTSLAATMAAIRLIDEEKERRWIVVPITGPLLLMAVIVGAYFYWNTPMRYGFVFALLVILSAAPWPRLKRRIDAVDRRRAEVDSAWQRQHAEEEAVRLQTRREAFTKLTADTPLWVLQEYTGEGDELRKAALTQCRQSPRRQADAEAMLDKGFSFVMRYLPGLDLEPTPALLAAGKKFVADQVRSAKPPVQDPGPFDLFARNVEYPMPGVHWLAEHGCDIRQELAALEAAVRQWGDTPRRQAMLTELAELTALSLSRYSGRG